MITFQNPTNANSAPSFEELLAKMMPSFEIFAKQDRQLSGDNYDDCIQDLTCLAFEFYNSLVQRGKFDSIFYSPIMKFSIGRVKEGRHFTGMSTTDICSDGTRLRDRSKVVSLDTLHGENDPREYLVDHRSNVSRVVGFKIDFFETWLVQQSERDQQIIHDLMIGESTNDVSRKYGVSAGLISQYRRRFADSWYSFQNGEKEETDLIEELRTLAAKTDSPAN